VEAGVVEELGHGVSSLQLYDLEVIVPVQGGFEPRSTVALVVPDPAVEGEIESFGTSVGLDRLAVVPC
jgi:hypothetical protein